jgi:hypothetical protein
LTATTNGVPPLAAMLFTFAEVAAGTVLPFLVTISLIASKAPLRILKPDGVSTPLLLVSAVNFMN